MKYFKLKFLLIFAALAMAIPPAWAGTVVDEITAADLTATNSQTYASFTGKTFNSNAVYAGKSAKDYNAIQIRSKNDDSGIVSTTSGGKVKSVTIEFNTNTTANRKVDVYGKNTAYTAAGNLFDASTKGTLLGSAQYFTTGENAGPIQVVNVDGDFEYVGLRSNSGALYIDKITIEWETEGGEQPTTPLIIVDEESLTINEDGGSFTVTGSNLVDNIGVTPSTGFVASPTSITNNEGSASSTVTVSYNGRDLYAEGTITMGTDESATSQEDITETLAVTYCPDIYLYGNLGSGWGFPEDSKMDYNGGIYSKTIDINSTGYILFARKLVEGNEPYHWNNDRLFFGAVTDGQDWLYVSDAQDDLDVNANVGNQYHPIKIVQEGRYTITINAAAKKFTISREDIPDPIVTCPAVIEFKDTDKDGTNAFDNDMSGFAEAISAGSGFVSGISSNKVYQGATGIKFSSSSVNGWLTINLATLTNGGSWKTTKVIVNAKSWTNSNGVPDEASFTINGSEPFSTTSEFADYELTFNEEELTSITIAATKRIYVKSITIMHECGEGPVIDQVAIPTFSHPGGNYDAPIEVAISCDTQGATIYYTIDGTEPTEASTVYEHPIAVAATTTINAIAMKDGMTNSVIATATYNMPQAVENIPQAYALDVDTRFTFTGEAVVTFYDGNGHLYIRDAVTRDGEAASGMIYYASTALPEQAFKNGDMLTPGWTAKYIKYQTHTPEFSNPKNVASTTNNGGVAPYALETIELADVNKYASMSNVTITGNNGQNYYINVGEQEICLRRAYTDLVNELEVGKVYNVEGVVAIFNETPQLNLTKVTLVKQNPELAFNPTSVTVYEGVQDFPEPELTAPEGVTVQNYTSSNPNVVTVDNEGKVTIVGVGTAVITATTAENDYYLSGTATYNVEIKAKEAAGLSFGVTEPVTATYGDGNNFDEPELTIPAGLTVTYSCKPETVATVDPSTGAVTIVGAGTATVTATTEGDESHAAGSASYTIVVAKADATMSFAKNSIEATYGGEVPANALTNEAGLTVTYESSDDNIATVDNEGKVTIVKAGEVTITATGAANDNYNEATARYTLTIAKAEATLSFAPNAFTIVEGQEFTAPTLTNEAGLAVTYSSGNEAVATVDTNSGEVTIVGVGSTTITATGAENDNYKGATATYTITVEAKPVVATPTFTPAAGYYNSAQNVTIACETTGADIYYTTDGTVPTTESTKFAEAITVGENLTIKAIAVKEGYTNSDIAEAEYVIDIPVQIAALTFMPGSGHYTEAKEVSIACATPGVTITYKIGDGEFQPYTKPFVVDHSCTVTAKATKDGRTVWTDSEASATYTINKLNPLGITDGYYQIKNNGNNKYANVQGRKTMTFTNDIDQQAGTVIRVQTKDNGQVQVLRSQAADLQGYADRAMRYVPEVVQMIANKLHAEGTGEILGNDGLDAIMEKFNESFDYHLYVEGDLNNARIYGKTPSMQPVVDFYNENQAKVDAKLPMLEDFINDAIQKVLNKTNNHGASILVPFSVDTIWNRMGGTLIRPIDAESTMAFYHQVLTNKQYVWDFAYQTATFYLEKVKAHPKYQEMQSEFGEYTQYIDKLEQIRPDMKYFIVQNNGKVDYISEGNVDIINNAPRTYWNVEPRSEFKVNFPAANEYGGNYVTTLYTDFAYDVPEEITAYKVSEVNENGNAVLTALKGTIPAQTPVLLVADSVGVYTLTLNIAPSALADTTGNQLHGPDYLINKYKINTPEVESVFNFAKETFGQTFYDNYVAQYEHLMLKSAGTVNNRYFWGLTDDDLTQCTYVNENNENDCVARTLSMGDQQLGFYSNWEAKTNQAFLVSEQFNPIKLSLLRDVNRDGKVSIADVAAQIDILLALPEKPYLDRYDYDAADFNEDGTIKIDDVAGLISYLLSH